MVFNNGQVVTRLNIRRYLSLLVYVTSMGLIILSGYFDRNVLGYEKSFYVLIVSAVYVLYIVYAYVLNYNFFSYSDEGEKLVFRFVSLRPFDNQKKAIEIKKIDFAGFKMEKYLFNLRKDLILSIKTKNGIADYPAISITALSEKHETLLKNSLSELL